MSSEKNKKRLFITLQYRLGSPGFHWALVLSPKSESDDKQNRDCHLFHATNSLAPGIPITPGKVPDWRYENKPTNALGTRSIVARALVAKLSGTESVEAQAKRIDGILTTVPIVQNDGSWNCVKWVQQALIALKGSGDDFNSIPDFNDGGKLVGVVRKFAEKAKEDVLDGKLIVRPSDLPLLDLRGR